MNSFLVNQNLARSWWLLLLMGIVGLLFGGLAMLNPVGVGAGLIWAVGVLALAEGILTLLAAVRKESPVPTGWLLVYGLVSVLFGLLALINPLSMAASMVMVTGFWICLSGILRIVMAVRVRKSIDNEWLLILSGVLAVVLGGLMLFMPVAGLIVAVIWIGLGALVYGLLQIVVALRVRRLAK